MVQGCLVFWRSSRFFAGERQQRWELGLACSSAEPCFTRYRGLLAIKLAVAQDLRFDCGLQLMICMQVCRLLHCGHSTRNAAPRPISSANALTHAQKAVPGIQLAGVRGAQV